MQKKCQINFPIFLLILLDIFTFIVFFLHHSVYFLLFRIKQQIKKIFRSGIKKMIAVSPDNSAITFSPHHSMICPCTRMPQRTLTLARSMSKLYFNSESFIFGVRGKQKHSFTWRPGCVIRYNLCLGTDHVYISTFAWDDTYYFTGLFRELDDYHLLVRAQCLLSIFPFY
jgi:hypothetical protein